jgi:hypothetical protein
MWQTATCLATLSREDKEERTFDSSAVSGSF